MPHTTPLQWLRQPASALTGDTAVQQDWNRLNAARRDLPFLDCAQIATALSCFGTGQEVLFTASGVDCKAVAMMVLAPEGPLKWRTFQPSQLPLAAWVSDGSVPLDYLLRHLLNTSLPRALAVTVSQLDPWIEDRPHDMADLETVDYIRTGWIEVDSDFETYWGQRSKDLKLNLRRRRKRLAEEGRQARLGVLTDPSEMQGAVQRYGALESAGWKGAEGTAVTLEGAQGRFYVQAMESAARVGEARVYEYWFDGQCVAVDLCQLRGDVLIVLKITYDESLKQLSPAFMLREEQMQHLFSEAKIRRIEFYGRYMEWHGKWAEKSRVLYHVTVYRRPWLSQLALTLRRLKALVRERRASSTSNPTTSVRE